MRPLEKSPYSLHFNNLVWLGGWLPDTKNSSKYNFFIIYKVILNGICAFGCVLFFFDLYYSLIMRDLKKTAWNICVSVLFMGAFTKMIQLLHRRKIVNDLRLKLHYSAETKVTPEYTAIHDLALKELRFIHFLIYGAATIFVPIWLLTRYFGKLREFPLPLWIPFEVDLQNDTQYTLLFIVISISGVFGLFFGVETELSMFTLFIQLSREYRILMQDIPKLNLLYDNSKTNAEVNPQLRKLKAHRMIKELSMRQREVIGFIQTFEDIFTQPFLQQFLSVSALIVLIGLQCMMETVDVLGSLMYQIGYLSSLSVNLFMMCWFSTRMKLLCTQVGETAYFTQWYSMELDTRKDLMMIILRAQNPPKITTGGLMELNLNAFLQSMSNITSWLILLRELQVTSTVPKTNL